MAEKKERRLTPVGEAKWAHVQTPKSAFVDEHGNTKGQPKYQIDVVFSPGEEKWAAWAKDIQDQIRALPEQEDKKTGHKLAKQSPIKRELDADDNPTGRFYVTFKTSDKFKPPVFDHFGRQFDGLIGNGSKVRVSYTENIFPTFGGGINLYLNAVQVLELVEYGNRSAESYGFKVDDEQTSDNPF